MASLYLLLVKWRLIEDELTIVRQQVNSRVGIPIISDTSAHALNHTTSFEVWALLIWWHFFLPFPFLTPNISLNFFEVGMHNRIIQLTNLAEREGSIGERYRNQGSQSLQQTSPARPLTCHHQLECSIFIVKEVHILGNSLCEKVFSNT